MDEWTRLPRLRCAGEDAGGQNVERLELLAHRAEAGFQIGQNRIGELVDQQGSIGAEHLAGLLHNFLAGWIGNQAVRDAGDNIVRAFQVEIGEHLASTGGGAVHDAQTGIVDLGLEKFDELRIQFDGCQYAVGAQPLQDLLGDRTHAGPVLDDHLSAVPIYLGKDIVYQEWGTGNNRPKHGGMPEKIAREQNQLRRKIGRLLPIK